MGLPLASNLIQKGYEVKGSTTSVDKNNNLTSKRIIPFVVDLRKRDYDLSDFLSSEVLIISVPSKIVDDFKNFIFHLEKSFIKKVIFISSISVYANSNQVVTEGSPVGMSALFEIENLFRFNTNFKSTIVRFGGLFGYDRKPGNFFHANTLIDNPEGFVNLIHRDDGIRILENIIKSNAWNETLNACADTHPTRRDFYTKEIAKVRKIKPVFNENSLNEYKIVSSEKLKNLLNYTFTYSDLSDYNDS